MNGDDRLEVLAKAHLPETCYHCDEEGTEPVWMLLDANGAIDVNCTVADDDPNAQSALFPMCKFHVEDAGYEVADEVDWPDTWHPERFN